MRVIQRETPDQVEGDQVDQAGPAPAAAGGLEALANKFEQLEAGGETTGQDSHLVDTAPAEPPTVPNSTIIASTLKGVRESVCVIATIESPRLLDNDKCDQLGAIWGEALDAMGIKLGASVGKYAPLLAAAMASLEILGPVVTATRAEIAAKDKARPINVAARPAAAAPAAAPGAPGPGYAEGSIRPQFTQ